MEGGQAEVLPQALTYLLDVDPVLNECVDVALPRPPATAILAQLPNQ